MNILLVEDNEQYLKTFTDQLSKLGNVTAFKSANGTRKFLYDTDIKFDLVVCDHNILRFEAETNSYAQGNEIYEEIRWGSESDVPFIHFSADPCPEKYDGSKEDKNFYSLKKSSSVDLCQYIHDKILNKKDIK